MSLLLAFSHTFDPSGRVIFFGAPVGAAIVVSSAKRWLTLSRAIKASVIEQITKTEAATSQKNLCLPFCFIGITLGAGSNLCLNCSHRSAISSSDLWVD